MEKKIKELRNYFIAKMLSNDFEIKEMNDCVGQILIDDKYQFNIWLTNEPNDRKPYHSWGGYFMEIAFTQKQSIKMHSILWKRIADYKENVILKEKRKQFEALKKELGED